MAVEDDPPSPYKLRDLQILTVTHGAEQPKKEAIYLPANIEVVLFTQEGDMLLFNIINKLKTFLIRNAANFKKGSLHELHNKKISNRSRNPGAKANFVKAIENTFTMHPTIIRYRDIEKSAYTSTITIYRGGTECPNLRLDNRDFSIVEAMGLVNIDQPDPKGKGSILNRNFITQFPEGEPFNLKELIQYLNRLYAADPTKEVPNIRLYLMCCRPHLVGEFNLGTIDEEDSQGILKERDSPQIFASINSEGLLHPRSAASRSRRIARTSLDRWAFQTGTKQSSPSA